jgi:hypothetical protein
MYLPVRKKDLFQFSNREVAQMFHSIVFSDNLKQVMNRFIFLVVLLTSVNVLATTRVTPVNETMQVNDKGCNVTVYQTPFSALKNGEIEEICVIKEASSGAIKISAEKVIKKNAHEACGCGTDKVYVRSQSEPNGASTHVVMVAFKYVNEQTTSLRASTPYKAVKRNLPAYGNSSKSRPTTTRRVFVDDYEQVLRTVTKSDERKMVWLGQKN